MKFEFFGFDGISDDPCYEDENGRLYFDKNNGRNGLNLYIWGKPDTKVTEEIECDEPFVRHVKEEDYRLLSRLQTDCEYFLGNGNGHECHLYYDTVEEHCDEMERLWDSFAAEEKPEWLTKEQIKNYREQMLKVRK